MRTLGGLAAALLFAMSCVPPAAASVPSRQERVDAKRVARLFWAARGDETLCHSVRFRFRAFRPSEIAYVPSHRDGTAKCVIVFNRRIDWGLNQNWGLANPWWQFCRLAIHEYGHLPGMPYEFPPIHSRNPNSIMVSTEEAQYRAWWYPHFPSCRFAGDDQDGDGRPDW